MMLFFFYFASADEAVVSAAGGAVVSIAVEVVLAGVVVGLSGFVVNPVLFSRIGRFDSVYVWSRRAGCCVVVLYVAIGDGNDEYGCRNNRFPCVFEVVYYELYDIRCLFYNIKWQQYQSYDAEEEYREGYKR